MAKKTEEVVLSEVDQLRAEFEELKKSLGEKEADLNQKNQELNDLKKSIKKKPKGVNVYTAADSAKADESLKRMKGEHFREDCMIKLGRPQED